MSAIGRAIQQMEQTNGHARAIGLTPTDVRAAIDRANDGRFDHLDEAGYWFGVRRLLTNQAASAPTTEDQP